MTKNLTLQLSSGQLYIKQYDPDTELKKILEEINEIVVEDARRATGRTTRLVDMYIQILFKNFGEWVEIRDHHDTLKSNDFLINKIGKRITLEHPDVKCFHNLTKQEMKLTKKY